MNMDHLLNVKYKIEQVPESLKWNDEIVKVYKLDKRRKYYLSTDNSW